MSEKLNLLIDGHSVAYRAFYAIPELKTSDGTPTNAVIGFFNILGKVWKEIKPSAIYCAFDLKEATFRHVLYPEYKANRKPSPETFKVQIPLLRQALPSLGINIMERAGLEADDLIGSAASYFASHGENVAILTSDKDILQVLTPKITIYRHVKSSTCKVYTCDSFAEEYGFSPDKMVDYLALMGDKADNIVGVPGFGEKTTAKLLHSYNSIEGILDHLNELKPSAKKNFSENYKRAIWNRELTRIKCDENLEEFFDNPSVPDLNSFKEFCHRIETKRTYELFSPLVEELIHSSEALKSHLSVKPEAIPEQSLTAADDATEQTESSSPQYNTLPIEEVIKAPLLALDMNGTLPHGLEPASEFLSSINVALISLEGKCWEGTMETLAPLISSAQKIICVDAKAVCGTLEQPTVKNLWDICSAWYLLHPDRGSYDVKKELSLEFGVERAFKLFSVYDQTNKELVSQKMNRVMSDIDLPIIPILVKMERRGIRLKRAQMQEVSMQLERKIDEVKDQISEASGMGEINLNSPKQIGILLFEKLGLPAKKKTKSGYSTDVTVLKSLDQDYRHITPVPGLILEHRELQKMLSGFVIPLQKSADSNDIIHSIFEAQGTGTGRLSSRDPNLQNLPVYGEWSEKIRECLVPADEKNCFISADYSQIELRVLAHLSGDPNLVSIFESGRDIHTETAALIFGIPPEAVTKELRRNAKTVSFGLIYGMGIFGLAQRLGCNRKDAAKIMDGYFAALPGVKQYLDNAKKTAMSERYSITAYGRRRTIDEIATGSGTTDHLMRAAVNAPIQGTAADITKIAMCKTSEHFSKKGVNIVLQVHDSIVCECPTDKAEEYSKELQEIMESAVELSVPLKTERKIGESLANV